MEPEQQQQPPVDKADQDVKSDNQTKACDENESVQKIEEPILPETQSASESSKEELVEPIKSPVTVSVGQEQQQQQDKSEEKPVEDKSSSPAPVESSETTKAESESKETPVAEKDELKPEELKEKKPAVLSSLTGRNAMTIKSRSMATVCWIA